MSDITILGIAAVPAILGIVQVLKDAGLPQRLCPLAALLLGAGVGAGQAISAHTDLTHGLVAGVALGLSACGLYSGASNTIGTRAAARRTEGHPPEGKGLPSGLSGSTVRPLVGSQSVSPGPDNRPIPTTWGTPDSE
jgi:hypothetical protein